MDNLLVRVLNRLNYFNKRFCVRKKTLHSLNWNIPVIDKIGYLFLLKNTEAWMFDFLKKIDTHVGIRTFLDVGVNIGQTMIKVKSINKDINYVGFEPNVNCTNYVNQLIKYNKLDNVRLVNCALANETGITKIHAFGEIDSRATLVEGMISPEDEKYSEWVLTTRLDDIKDSVLGNENVDLIKVDVEGFELDVFKGAVSMIRNNKPIMIFEVLPTLMDVDQEKNQKELYELMSSLDYNVYRINSASLELSQVKGGFNNSDDYTMSEYVAFHNEANYIRFFV